MGKPAATDRLYLRSLSHSFTLDWVCAFRLQEDAERFFRVLPKRLAKFHLQVAPEKTHLCRFSRFHPSTKRRFTFLGFAFFWTPDRHGVPRVMRRTARKKLQAARQRLTEWIKQHRHLPGAGVLPASECATTRPLQLLWRTRERPLAEPLLPLGDGLYVSMAQPAGRQAEQLYMGAVYPRP
jgi:hypothetical protein